MAGFNGPERNLQEQVRGDTGTASGIPEFEAWSEMSDMIVTVRVPKSLLYELRRVSSEDHFLDLSEAVRSILRKNWISSSDKNIYEIGKLREEIAESIKAKSRLMAEQMLTEELKKIRRGLNNDIQ